jgi:prolyl oligopeptidase
MLTLLFFLSESAHAEAPAAAAPIVAPAADEDPYLWLEEVTGERALDWVRARDAESKAAIGKGDYAKLEKRFLSILNADDRIPYVSKMGDLYYNFWTDAAHPRGIWRRTTLEEFRKPAPKWETVLDVDALGKAENENWVWHGATCLEPAWTRCMIALSRGGADADVKREFDLPSATWVKDGFRVDEAKSEVSWIDADRLWVMTDTGPGSLTQSGYPREARAWDRGTPIERAPVLFSGDVTDVAAGAWTSHDPGYERHFLSRTPTFFTSRTWVSWKGLFSAIAVPDDASPTVWRDWLFVELRTDWTVGGKTWPAGALIATKFDDFMQGKREFSAVFAPTPTTALRAFVLTPAGATLTVMDNVKSVVSVAKPGPNGWTSAPLPGLPAFGSISVSAVDGQTSDDLWITVTDFITPTQLLLGSATGTAPTPLKSMPSSFKATGLEITQHFTTSADGTRIPYFQVAKKGLKLDGKNPTLLYGYGGFEVSMLPNYNPLMGAAWLERGGVYVLANIRGGGEYGPTWHSSVLNANRPRVYEDFAAVARDLATRRVTSAEHLGTMGGSNGGLLMGNMMTQYPELFGAIVCQVPLLDMKRYSHLLAGASWVDEYGDPDLPEEWAWLQTFSPYHLERADRPSPPVLFTTSTRDDRVHPGHARKLAARMLEHGKPVLYYEDMEGGHGGASTPEQRARLWALAWSFLWMELR